MLTRTQERTIKAIVNIFETGRITGDYGRVTLLEGDSGLLTYGRNQATLASGNLHLLVKAYCAAEGAGLAAAFAEYLPLLALRDVRLNRDYRFHALLREAGSDPVMQRTQRSFFRRNFWIPARKAATLCRFEEPLSIAVIYDSIVHGSWRTVKKKVEKQEGIASDVGERKWIPAYLRERRHLLATHRNSLLRQTVYRMDAFNSLVSDENWKLELPLLIRGVRVNAVALYEDQMDGLNPASSPRNLRVSRPLMRGVDVERLEEALLMRGYANMAAGVFNDRLASVVKAFQADNGLVIDGIVGPATRQALMPMV